MWITGWKERSAPQPSQEQECQRAANRKETQNIKDTDLNTGWVYEGKDNDVDIQNVRPKYPKTDETKKLRIPLGKLKQQIDERNKEPLYQCLASRGEDGAFPERILRPEPDYSTFLGLAVNRLFSVARAERN
jgi:hypothetical protein